MSPGQFALVARRIGLPLTVGRINDQKLFHFAPLPLYLLGLLPLDRVMQIELLHGLLMLARPVVCYT